MRLAHQMAMESRHIRAEAVDATQFPRLASLYRVMAVPKVVVGSGRVQFEGALPEPEFVGRVLQAVSS